MLFDVQSAVAIRGVFGRLSKCRVGLGPGRTAETLLILFSLMTLTSP